MHAGICVELGDRETVPHAFLGLFRQAVQHQRARVSQRVPGVRRGGDVHQTGGPAVDVRHRPVLADMAASRRRGTVVRRGGNRCGHHPGRSAQSRLASGEGQRGHQGAQIAADQTDRHTHQRGRRAVARNVRQTARAGGAGV